MLDFRHLIRDQIGKNHRGLEIGASFSPILPKAAGYRTLVVDHADSDELRRKYAAMGVDVSRIEEVDAVDDGGEFTELDLEGGGFDFIVASHVFEHVTDPIHFLQRCERALKPNGLLFLLVPDRRFCFDYLRPVSTAGQMLGAYLAQQRRHSPAALFDHHAYHALSNGAFVWAAAPTGPITMPGSPQTGYAAATRRSAEYEDCHAWVFTPSSFRLIVMDLRIAGLIGLGETFFHPSIGCEFLAVLSPTHAGQPADRLALAMAALTEVGVEPMAEAGTAAGSATAARPAEPATPAVPIDGDAYVQDAPSPQHAVDTLAGSWVCALPARIGVRAGEIPLYEDGRIHWLVQSLGGSLAGLDVLELGPLEASHTAMLLAAGAASVLAIEAHRTAFLRCLVVKELLGLRDASFLLGNFVPYLEAERRHWKLIVASGVLYHMTDPLHLLELLAERTDRLFLWTHVVDHAAMPLGDPRWAPIVGQEERSWRGATVTLHRRPYAGPQDPKFCGGPVQGPRWMEREDLLLGLRRLGFDTVTVATETPDHPAGPALSILAIRTRPPTGTNGPAG